MKKTLSLYELNTLVGQVIESTMPNAYWVEAEVSEAREHSGHLYLELIEKDDRTHTPIARASAKCWRTTWSVINSNFQRITGMRLRAGIKLMLQVYAQFHPQYGFSWIVADINPEYTMGDMARKRKEIIEQLKAAGIFDLQKELVISKFANRIAVISSESAAGYGDFVNQLLGNDYGLPFYTTLFPAVMQGEQVERSIIAALDSIHTQEENFDCVVIIRGGGATADLSGFDTLALAENVANFPLPIITGIGHERDESILDMVSNTRVKTPTAAAAFLIENLANTYNTIENFRAVIQRFTEQKLQLEVLRIERLQAALKLHVANLRNRGEQRLKTLSARMMQGVLQQITQQRLRIERLSLSLAPAMVGKLRNEQHRIELLHQKIEAIDPERLLKRGYSITYHRGKVIKSVNDLKSGDHLTTVFENGEIYSIVTDNTELKI